MPDLIVLFTGIVVFSQMFIVGLRHAAPADLPDLLRETLLLSRSLAAVLLLVPLLTFVLIALLQPPAEVALGLALLAAAPGAPLTTRRSEAAGADTRYVSTLQLTLALLAILFTPAMLAAFDLIIDVSPPSVTPATVAAQVGVVTFVPVALGWSLSRYAPQFIDDYEGVLELAAKGLYIAFIVVALLALISVPQLQDMLLIGSAGTIAVIAMALVAIAVGHALSGGSKQRRAGLAIATVARNLGLALYIAELSPKSIDAIPTILTYGVVAILVALPYSRWMKRQSEADSNPA